MRLSSSRPVAPLTCIRRSPKINHNLLTRSEVVALVNTLHRFTESLVAVNDFRKMWAREEHGRRGILLEGVDGSAAASPVRTPPSSSPPHRSLREL